jgi:hypothetical protein
MTAYDTIVSMGVEIIHVPRLSRLYGVRGGGGSERGLEPPMTGKYALG